MKRSALGGGGGSTRVVKEALLLLRSPSEPGSPTTLAVLYTCPVCAGAVRTTLTCRDWPAPRPGTGQFTMLDTRLQPVVADTNAAFAGRAYETRAVASAAWGPALCAVSTYSMLPPVSTPVGPVIVSDRSAVCAPTTSVVAWAVSSLGSGSSESPVTA